MRKDSQQTKTKPINELGGSIPDVRFDRFCQFGGPKSTRKQIDIICQKDRICQLWHQKVHTNHNGVTVFTLSIRVNCHNSSNSPFWILCQFLLP